MPIVAIFNKKKILVYEVPENVLEELPGCIFGCEEAEDAATTVMSKGRLVQEIKPDYSVDLRICG